ncbi:MAG: hypothetical protein IJO64_00075 [Clostridia bacterium]|nr:hypothetical protein [Clostridia bacterium]
MGLFNRKPKPVENIEVSVYRPKLRLAIVLGFLLIGFIALGIGLFGLLNKNNGWTAIEMTEKHPEIESELIFNYNLGKSGVKATAEYKSISALYQAEATKAYRVFHATEEFEGVNNLSTLSSNINKAFEVDPLLYNALKMLEEEGSRLIYLAPLYSEHESLCISEQDSFAELHDPALNKEAAEYSLEILKYAMNPDMITLELLEGNRVRLRVAKVYQDFAEENEITSFVDLYWLKNAFVVDAVADAMISNGYTNGNITSFDGFTRNFDNSGEEYSMNVFNCRERLIYPAGAVKYKGASAFVAFRNYPMSDRDGFRYYTYSNGNIVNPYINTANGFSNTNNSELLVASKTKGCAETALKAFECFVSEELGADALKDLLAEDIASVWCEETTVVYNSDEFPIGVTFSEGGVAYSSKKA